MDETLTAVLLGEILLDASTAAEPVKRGLRRFAHGGRRQPAPAVSRTRWRWRLHTILFRRQTCTAAESAPKTGTCSDTSSTPSPKRQPSQPETYQPFKFISPPITDHNALLDQRQTHHARRHLRQNRATVPRLPQNRQRRLRPLPQTLDRQGRKQPPWLRGWSCRLKKSISWQKMNKF